MDNPEVAVLGDVVDVYVQSFFSASAEGGKLAEFSTLEGLGLRNSRFDAVWIETLRLMDRTRIWGIYGLAMRA